MTAIQDITDWRSSAACMSADPDLFFPISSAGPALSQVAQAKAICGSCQVRQACLDFALATGQVHGVWGGTTEEERQLLRLRSQPRPRPAAGPVRARPQRRQSQHAHRPPAR